jgi:subtilisin family serine protease
MNPLDLVRLTPLMERTSGRPEILVALIDGPVMMENPDLSIGSIRELKGKLHGTCSQASSSACTHGTFVAGILSAKRGSAAPAICPNCTLLLRPIFSETVNEHGEVPSATPDELADAIAESIAAGASVLNMSVGLVPSTRGEQRLKESLDYAAKRGVIVVAAAGNHGLLGSSVITRHPWIIPVTACDLNGRVSPASNLGVSIGRRGLSAPGEGVTSLGTNGDRTSLRGTSVATPFVTGTVALLWSQFPSASANDIRSAVTGGGGPRRHTLVPPVLDAWAASKMLANGA